MQAPPTLVVQSGERAFNYRLYEIEDAYYVQREDIPVYFSLAAFDYDRLNDARSATLFPVAEPGGADPENEPDVPRE